MGCSGCGAAKAAKLAASYPKKIVLPDGSRSEASSPEDERAQRRQAAIRMREAARVKGYTVTQR